MKLTEGMKVFNLLFCLLFVFSAALQYNDPDPYIWMPIYLYGATLCWLAFRNKYYPKAYLVGIGIYVVYAISLLCFVVNLKSRAFSYFVD